MRKMTMSNERGRDSPEDRDDYGGVYPRINTAVMALLYTHPSSLSVSFIASSGYRNPGVASLELRRQAAASHVQTSRRLIPSSSRYMDIVPHMTTNSIFFERELETMLWACCE